MIAFEDLCLSQSIFSIFLLFILLIGQNFDPAKNWMDKIQPSKFSELSDVVHRIWAPYLLHFET